LPELPEGAEGWFAVPSVDALAEKYFPEVTTWTERRRQAILLVNSKIADSRPFTFFCEEIVASTPFQVPVHTTRALKLIAETQPGGILIVAAQLGRSHRGRSIRLACKMFAADEFGLGSLEVGSILLTHPERLVDFLGLFMDCPGDEFAQDNGDDSSFGIPSYGFDIGGIEFHINDNDDTNGQYGPATGFLSSEV